MKRVPLQVGTGDVDVGEELHLDLLVALAGAGLAASAGDVERKGRGGITAQPGQARLGEEGADRIEGLEEGGRVGAARLGERRLIDECDVGDEMGIGDLVVLARRAGELAEAFLESAVEDRFHQRRLARAGDAGNADQARQRQRDAEDAQVVLARTADDQAQIGIDGSPLGRHRDAAATREVFRRRRAGRGQLGEGTGVDDLAAAIAGARSEIDDVIRFADDLGFVLDDDHRVLLGAQLFENAHQTLAVARMQTDRGLVENVEGIDQRRADGTGQVDAGELTTGERARLAIEGQIVEPDGEQVTEAVADLGQDQRRDLLLLGGETKRGEESCAIADAHLVDVDHVLALNPVEQRVRPEAAAIARRAHPVAAIAREQHAHVHLVGASFEPAKPAADAVELLVAVDDQPALFRGQRGKGALEGNPALPAEARQRVALPLRRLGVPRLDRPLRQRLARVGDGEVEIDVDDATEAAAGLAGAERAVEGEQIRRRIAQGDTTARAFELLAEGLRGEVAVGEDGGAATLAEAKGLFDRAGETRLQTRPCDQAVGHDRQARRTARQALDLQRLAVDQHATEAGGDQALPRLLPGKILRHIELECDQHSSSLRGAQQLGGHRFRSVAPHRLVALRAVGNGDFGEQQLEVIVQLGHGADARARSLDRVSLTDGDSGQDALDRVDVRFVHAIEKLPGVRREALHVAPLPLRIEHVKCEARLA